MALVEPSRLSLHEHDSTEWHFGDEWIESGDGLEPLAKSTQWTAPWTTQRRWSSLPDTKHNVSFLLVFFSHSCHSWGHFLFIDCPTGSMADQQPLLLSVAERIHWRLTDIRIQTLDVHCAHGSAWLTLRVFRDWRDVPSTSKITQVATRVLIQKRTDH